MGKLDQARHLRGPLLTCDEGPRLGAHNPDRCSMQGIHDVCVAY